MEINANTLVNGGFPPEEGRQLAATLLERNDIDWSELTIDVSKCAAALLISAFFNGFLQEVYDRRSDLLGEAKGISWELQFPFQLENVKRWINDFKPYTAS